MTQAQRDNALINNSLDWYLVDYIDGTTKLQHETALSSILMCSQPKADFGVLGYERCWNYEDLR